MGDYSTEVISSIDRDYIASFLDTGKRIDGRAMNECRNTEIELDVVAAKAEGSALVHLGDTVVIAGVKVLLGEPYGDSPDKGVMMVTAELPPLASPLFELGPPKEPAIELARVVDRGVRESEMIDTASLCIEPGKKVYMVFADIYPLDYDGNLIDASSLAVAAALQTTKYDEYKWEDGTAVLTGKKLDLPIQNSAVEVTVSRIGRHLVIDPSLKEEMVQDCRLTMAVDKNDKLRAMQKGGGSGPLTLDEIETSITMAIDRAQDLHKLIDETIKARKKK
ncbi:MAG: exosome complex protein Rrp42 [Candidatus Thorarchaeota archaeon]|jgi:exosome complex component RRP42|nr:exosome complex protein Rrp42 [Candidatus Thorarchaeota archaeon]